MLVTHELSTQHMVANIFRDILFDLKKQHVQQVIDSGILEQLIQLADNKHHNILVWRRVISQIVDKFATFSMWNDNIWLYIDQCGLHKRSDLLEGGLFELLKCR